MTGMRGDDVEPWGLRVEHADWCAYAGHGDCCGGVCDCLAARANRYVADLEAEVESLKAHVKSWGELWEAERDEHAECEAEVERLTEGVRKIGRSRCLGNLRPPGCAGNCVTCQARALLDDRENHK